MNKLEELRKNCDDSTNQMQLNMHLGAWMEEVELELKQLKTYCVTNDAQVRDINARSLVIRDNPVDAMNDMVAVAYGTGVEYKPLKEYHEASEASGECDEIAKGHNPDKLTVAQVGEGYRLLDKDEVIGHKNLPAIKEIECYTEEGQWEGGYTGSTKDFTYRVPESMSRSELAKGRGLEDAPLNDPINEESRRRFEDSKKDKPHKITPEALARMIPVTVKLKKRWTLVLFIHDDTDDSFRDLSHERIYFSSIKSYRDPSGNWIDIDHGGKE